MKEQQTIRSQIKVALPERNNTNVFQPFSYYTISFIRAQGPEDGCSNHLLTGQLDKALCTG